MDEETVFNGLNVEQHNRYDEYTRLDWFLFYTIEFPVLVVVACFLFVLFWSIDKLRDLLVER